MTDPVQAQYEAYPYPSRDPRDEAKRLLVGSPGQLDELNHCLFAGRRDFTSPFRVLVAGGGTGDAAIMLAQQLADRRAPGEVVWLDLSEAARQLAEARAAARKLDNISFVTGDLLDLPTLAPGPYDYIDCCGVLHHLAEPERGLAVLAAALAPGGGMGLMLYGRYGRTGLYPLQRVLRQLAGEQPLAEQVTLARRLLDGLPRTNWFRRNPFLGDHKRSDAELVDLLLHARDRAYDVPALFALLDGAGLKVTRFLEPMRYDPRSYLKDPKVTARFAGLSWRESAAIAEVLSGNMKTHVVYVARDESGVEGPESDRVARVEGPATIPRVPFHDGPRLAEATRRSLSLTVEFEGLPLTLPLPRLAPAILARIDGRTSFGAIHTDLREADAGLTWERFAAEVEALNAVLGGANIMVLATPPDDAREALSSQ